eukprot:TRINITY_DN24491_c0_g1_i1.p1 TRINITY_DN24491_c0_g1~~TRINITY_DN24491_c0_g1_i1.p1  ORF type:complete len:174 (-),score=5.14 TRINITY_DN24491_c0_g1_i1:153-623(-)
MFGEIFTRKMKVNIEITWYPIFSYFQVCFERRGAFNNFFLLYLLFSFYFRVYVLIFRGGVLEGFFKHDIRQLFEQQQQQYFFTLMINFQIQWQHENIMVLIIIIIQSNYFQFFKIGKISIMFLRNIMLMYFISLFYMKEKRSRKDENVFFDDENQK